MLMNGSYRLNPAAFLRNCWVKSGVGAAEWVPPPGKRWGRSGTGPRISTGKTGRAPDSPRFNTRFKLPKHASGSVLYLLRHVVSACAYKVPEDGGRDVEENLCARGP